MKALVTGGAGFMGSAFVRLFSQGEFPKVKSLTILDSLTYAGDYSRIGDALNSNIRFVQGDINDFDLVSKIMSEVDICINYAAETHVDNSISNPRPFINTNILGTEILLEAAKNSNIGKFVQISTDEVYGEIKNGEWTEESALDPSSPYSASKLSADLLVRAFYKTFKLPVIITRSCNNYGPFQNKEKFIPKIISNLKNELTIPIYGNGENIREWLYVYDHARATYLAVTSGKIGEIYNIGSGYRISNLGLAEKILGLMSLKKDRIEFVEDRFGHDFRYALNSSKANAELNFFPKVDFETGIRQTISSY